MLLMIKKEIRSGIFHAIQRQRIITSYVFDANNPYGWAMSQRLPVNRFEWEKYTSKFNEKFIKSYDENTDIRYILEEDVEYP